MLTQTLKKIGLVTWVCTGQCQTMTDTVNVQQMFQMFSLNFQTTSPLEPIITDAPSVENAFKFSNSNFKFEIRFIKHSWIVWELPELVSEKLRRSIDAVCASPFSWSQYLIYKCYKILNIWNVSYFICKYTKEWRFSDLIQQTDFYLVPNSKW